MSRIGKRELIIPDGVSTTIDNQNVTIKGPKGELTWNVHPLVRIKVVDNKLTTEKVNDSKESNAQQGTTNSLIDNMIIGVTKGFEKELETTGVGYRFSVSGNKVTVNAGYSHPVIVEVPKGLEVDVPSNTELTVKGIDKQLVGELAANIRDIRRPEPYKGKGIRYKDEIVRRKEGKKASK